MALTEQVRRAAIKAGLMGINGTSVATHKLEAFADYLLDEENEACAVTLDKMANEAEQDMEPSTYVEWVRDNAEAIRMRRKQ